VIKICTSKKESQKLYFRII